jgi:hypothetical protein
VLRWVIFPTFILFILLSALHLPRNKPLVLPLESFDKKKPARQMDLYNASAWLHPQPTTPDSSQHAQHEGRQSSTDDWKDRPTPIGAGSPNSSQPNLDLSEFTMDIPGEQFS